MNWQVKYALANFSKPGERSKAEHVAGDFIKVSTPDRPDVFAAIAANETINIDAAIGYREQFENLDFLCGYRTSCDWEGDAIR